MEFNQDRFQEYMKQYGQVVAKAWADDDFKQRLLANPGAVLSEEGIALPTNVEVRAVDTDKVVYLTLPSKPSEDLTDEQLNQMSGGSTFGSAASAGTLSCPAGTFSTIGSAGSAS